MTNHRPKNADSRHKTTVKFFLLAHAAIATLVLTLCVYAETQIKIKGATKIPLKSENENKQKAASILKFSEQHELDEVNKSVALLKNVPLEDLDASCRNFTQLQIQSAYYEVNNFLMNYPAMQKTAERDKTVKAASGYLLSAAKKNNGIAPAHDTLCTMMWLIQDFANMGYKKDSPLMKKHVDALMKLKIQNGWLQLQFTHKPGMKPEVEKTAKALVGLFMAGYEPHDAVTRAPLETLDKLLLAETNKEGHLTDWFVGVPWAMLLYKKIGAQNLKAYQKARDELIFAAMQGPDTFHSNAFMRGLTLMALQGVIPESAYPYQKAKQEVEAAWNGKTFSSSAIIWSKEFNVSGRHSLMPAFALAGYGYEGKLFPFKNKTLSNCGLASIMKNGTAVTVESFSAPVIEWTADDFRTIKSSPMKKQRKNIYTYNLVNAAPFEISCHCKNYWYFSGWYK